MQSPSPNPSPLLPRPRHRFLVPGVLLAISTGAAFASHAMFGAPGDHPVFLLVVGCVLAVAVGTLRMAPPVAAGFASLAGFPIEAIVDLALHGGHNLLPFEFLIYAAYGFLGVLLAKLGRAVGARVMP